MPQWFEIDEQLAAKVKEMVAAALSSTPAPSPTVALEVTRQVMQLADRLIEQFEAANVLPQPIVCRAGCSFCCHNEVEVTLPEAFLMAHMLRQFTSPEKQQAIKELAARRAAQKAGKSPAEIAARRQACPCPLLMDDRCSLYPWRPLVCRAMHSLDSEHCRESLHRGDLASDACYLHRHVFTLSLSAGMTEGFRAVGCRPETLELSQALWQALAEPEALKRWLRGKKAFEEAGR